MPIVLTLTAQKGKQPKRGIDHFWSVIMDHEMRDLTFTVSDVFARSNAKRNDVYDFVTRLVLAGLVNRVSLLPNGEYVYKAAVRQSATPRLRRDGSVMESASKQQCMWNTIRSPSSRAGFTAQDVAVWGSTDDIRISKDAAKAYIQMLAEAGYLIQVEKGGPNKLAIWRLDPEMNTGPLPPMVMRTQLVFDQNRHEVMGESTATEVPA